MSMTKEEAFKWLEEIVQDTDTYWGSCSKALQKELDEQKQVFLLALSALRPVSREQVEKVWRGEWIKKRKQTYIPVEYDEQGEVILHDFVVYRCSICGRENTKEEPFCNCGAPMTDEAVQMVMERMEALYGQENT